MTNKFIEKAFDDLDGSGRDLEKILAFSAIDVEIENYNFWIKKKRKTVAWLYDKLCENELKDYDLLYEDVSRLLESGNVDEAVSKVMANKNSGMCHVFVEAGEFDNWINAQWDKIRAAGFRDNYGGWKKSGVGMFHLSLDV